MVVFIFTLCAKSNFDSYLTEIFYCDIFCPMYQRNENVEYSGKTEFAIVSGKATTFYGFI